MNNNSTTPSKKQTLNVTNNSIDVNDSQISTQLSSVPDNSSQIKDEDKIDKLFLKVLDLTEKVEKNTKLLNSKLNSNSVNRYERKESYAQRQQFKSQLITNADKHLDSNIISKQYLNYYHKSCANNEIPEPFWLLKDNASNNLHFLYHRTDRNKTHQRFRQLSQNLR